MDLLARYYISRLSDLRMIELKEILSQIRMSKQGIKKDLVYRILQFFQEERKIGEHRVANMIEESHRKLYPSDISRGAVLPVDSNVGPQDQKIRCVCGIKLKHEGFIMIRCEDPSCGVWQHKSCVLIPEKLNSAAAALPEPFYCELCRLSRADPFCVTLPMFPLRSVKLPAIHAISRTFVITGEYTVRISKKECDVQAWCMLLNDEVRFRVQWPKHVDLKVNGIQMKATNRPGSMVLGANGRDDGVIISNFIKVGINNITVDARDARVFCLGVRFVERRTVKQVMELIPRESEGENLEDAIARVARCVGGGGDRDGDDLQLVSDSIPVNLRCPMSGLRMKVAGRFKRCAHMGCFDLEVFVEMSMRSKKWQCPICLKNYCLSDLIIDPYFNRIAAKLRNLGQDVNEVEVMPDGSWRAKPGSNGDHLGAQALWRSPDGWLCMQMAIGQAEQAHGSEVRNSTPCNVVVTANGDEFGDDKVIVLSDSEETENESVASDVLVVASVKRASEGSDARFSFPYKRRTTREYVSIDSD